MHHRHLLSTLVLVVVIAATRLGTAQEISPIHQSAFLPPLLRMLDGAPVATAKDWKNRRSEIQQLMCRYFIGTFPEQIPKLIAAEVLAESIQGDNVTKQRIQLTFDTPKKVSFEIRVWIPAGDGPFPLLLTQPLDYQLDWAKLAVARGYMVALYPGADSFSEAKTVVPGYSQVHTLFQQEYPRATWTEISTKAWIASRTLDYLLSGAYKQPIAPGQVAIIGHSRHGKQSLIAAAFDERITSVVARSPGSPGSCPYRFTARTTCAEAPADFPGSWFLPELRRYTGREHDLPIDAHAWLGLIAPRRCLIHTAHNDGADPTFATEQAYMEGSKVYTLLGKPENLRIAYRVGGHNPITDEHRQENIDWFDLSFNRDSASQKDFREEFIHHFDWNEWKSKQATELENPFPTVQPHDISDRRRRIIWMLGEEPEFKATNEYQLLSDTESAMMTHDRWAIPDTARMPVSFGDRVRGNIYYNTNNDQPAPVVIWLHPYSYHSGYNEGYGVEETTVYHRLAKEGYIVLAFDQCGFGLRLLEGRDFYEGNPRWSKLGRMVYDVRSAVDFLVDGHGRSKDKLPSIDKAQIHLLGFALGGNVALHAAALDDRISSVASFGGFTPLRTDTDFKRTGGIRRLWELHSLQPRLGLFQGREETIPYDYEDLFALIAPRPCFVSAPMRDRDADAADLAKCRQQTVAYWPANLSSKQFEWQTPDDINRFQKDQQMEYLLWLRNSDSER